MPSVAEREGLIDAVVKVAERSLFAFAEPVPAGAMPRSIEGGWYDATVSFSGPFAGRVSVVMPTALAGQMCAAFLGVGETEVGDEGAVRDLAGEFANMACGAWLTTLDASGCFDLTHPDVTRRDRSPVPDLAVNINDLPVGLVVRLEAAP